MHRISPVPVLFVAAAFLAPDTIASRAHAASAALVERPAPYTRDYAYVSPIPGSRWVSRFNNIAIRQGELIDPSSVQVSRFAVVGSVSGLHTGALVLSDDGKTLVFNPHTPFAVGERVSVTLSSGMRTLAGTPLATLAFDFEVSHNTIDQPEARRLGMLPSEVREPEPLPAAIQAAVRRLTSAGVSCDTFPPGYPAITITTANPAASERYFLAPFGGTPGSNLVILDGFGVPLMFLQTPGWTRAFDFKAQLGHLTAWVQPASFYYEYDPSYAIVDSFQAGNGLATDSHGMNLLPNGHALIQAQEGQYMDLSQIVPGGNPNAWVVGYDIQELDENKNVIFQWRSFDHYAITDCVSKAIDLTAATVDYCHGNAFVEDTDGNYLISARHLSEVSKIDRNTGNFIWRLGLNAVNNQFTFVGDDRGFSLQHDIQRRADNGDITLFDNGNDSNPPYSRALEYHLDEENKVATLLWQYCQTPPIFTSFMGDVQRHEDGSTTIGWGGTNSGDGLTDLGADGITKFALQLTPGTWSYRGFRFPWDTNRFSTDVTTLDYGYIAPGSSASQPVTVTNNSASDVTITCLASTSPAFTPTGPVPFTLGPGESQAINVTFAPQGAEPYLGSIYVRQVSNSELVARAVVVRGWGTPTTGVSGGADLVFALDQAQPSPSRGSARIGFSLPRAQYARLDVFDVSGRKVATLVDGPQTAGSHETVWNSHGRPSGLYFYRLWTPGRSLTRKVALTE